MSIDRNERLELLRQFRCTFRIELLWFEQIQFSGYRDDVSVHGWFQIERPVTPAFQLDARRWFGEKNWHISRQIIKAGEWDVECIYLCPMRRVALQYGFHATRWSSVPSIMATGLRPSSPEFQTITIASIAKVTSISANASARQTMKKFLGLIRRIGGDTIWLTAIASMSHTG